MTLQEFILNQPIDRQDILSKIHSIIITEDKTVEPKIGNMMRNEMILYNCSDNFKYGLASVKKHISLHLMPIYARSLTAALA